MAASRASSEGRTQRGSSGRPRQVRAGRVRSRPAQEAGPLGPVGGSGNSGNSGGWAGRPDAVPSGAEAGGSSGGGKSPASGQGSPAGGVRLVVVMGATLGRPAERTVRPGYEPSVILVLPGREAAPG